MVRLGRSAELIQLIEEPAHGRDRRLLLRRVPDEIHGVAARIVAERARTPLGAAVRSRELVSMVNVRLVDALEDALRVISSMNDAGVDYVIVGGAAMNLHGFVRATEDLDVFIRPDR